jgi:hypothetical protein
VWLYCSTCTKGKLPNPLSSWEGLYKVVTQINDVVYRIQQNPRSRMMVVHLERLALLRPSSLKEGATGAVG